MDFSIKTYKSLLHTLHNQGFSFQPFQEFLTNPLQKTIILRHDVDKLPQNSLVFAQIQNELGIKGTYYFRAVPESWNERIILKIAELGHEIGYHYEDIDFAFQQNKKQDKSKKIKVNNEKELAGEAIVFFEKHLAELRKYYPVKTICMHGSPRSKYDNKLLWEYYNYRDYGIIGEPYFDINFDEVFYLTDTGRRWDGWKSSLRDKVPQQEIWKKQGLVFHSTNQIIQAAKKGRLLSGFSGRAFTGRTFTERGFAERGFAGRAFTERSRSEMPTKIMFTFHPQRWTNDPVLWTKEFVLQKAKNVVKYFLNRVR